MKKLFLFIALTAFAIISATTQTNAQARFGIKAGATLTTLGSATANGVTVDYNYRPGFQGGVFAELPIAKAISFNPQVLFTQKGGNINTTVSGINLTGHTQINYLDLPLLFGFKATPKLSFFVGPQVSFLMSTKTVVSVTGFGTQESTDKTGVKNTLVGGNLGAGYDLTNNIGVNLHYMFDFGRAGEGSNDTGEKNSGFALTLGYKF